MIARARTTCRFPANFQFVAAANPCPCGWHASGVRDCRCDDATLARYAARISGPLLDRIDLHQNLRPVAWSDLLEPRDGDSSTTVRARVDRALERQGDRHAHGPRRANADIPDARLDACVDATADARQLLGRAVQRYALSARAARKVLKVARTIADLADEARVGPGAVTEALRYRAETPQA